MLYEAGAFIRSVRVTHLTFEEDHVLSSRIKGFLVGVTVLLIGFLIAHLRNQVVQQERNRELQEVLEVVEQNIEAAIGESYATALTLALTVNTDGEVENFDEVAAQLHQNSVVDVLELVPDGVIQYAYPLEGNEEVIGYDILSDPKVNREVKKAAELGTIYFAGPLELKQGGMAVIGRLPIIINDEIWGYSAVLIYLETLIQRSGINGFSADRYYFQLSKTDPNTGEEEFFLPVKEGADLNSFELVQFPEGDWKLYAGLVNQGLIDEGGYLLLIFVFIVSLLSGYISYKLFNKPAELEELLEIKSEEIRKSNEQLRRNSKLLQSVFESPKNMIIFSIDQNYRYMAFTKAHQRFIKSNWGKEIKLGDSILDIIPDERMRENVKARYDRALGGEYFQDETEFTDSNGEKKFWENRFSPIKSEDSNVIGITVFSSDITFRKEAERKIQEALDEKTTLLAEIHHRVKNNLAIVSGLLELQSREIDDERIKIPFQQSVNRIMSIAMVHELMYKSPELSSVNIQLYLDQLLPAIKSTVQDEDKKIELDTSIEDFRLNINEAIPLGLLFNELFTNSFKYAFNGRDSGRIEVILSSQGDKVEVHYSDNGVGFSEDVDFDNPSNLGLTLIHTQLAQLEAEYEADTNNKFQLTFRFKAGAYSS